MARTKFEVVFETPGFSINPKLVSSAIFQTGITYQGVRFTVQQVEEVGAEVWKRAAQLHLSNEMYYRAIVMRIGELFGDAAKICDDGTKSENVLSEKVYQLVKELVERSKNNESSTK